MNNSKDYLDKVVSIIDKPYFQELELYGINDKDEREYIFKQIYGFEITLITGRFLGDSIYDSNGNKIYYEDSTGEWYKIEYDSDGNKICYVDSKGVINDYR